MNAYTLADSRGEWVIITEGTIVEAVGVALVVSQDPNATH